MPAVLQREPPTLADVPRMFPQFGKSLKNLARPAWQVFGQSLSLLSRRRRSAAFGGPECGCAPAGDCGCHSCTVLEDLSSCIGNTTERQGAWYSIPIGGSGNELGGVRLWMETGGDTIIREEISAIVVNRYNGAGDGGRPTWTNDADPQGKQGQPRRQPPPGIWISGGNKAFPMAVLAALRSLCPCDCVVVQRAGRQLTGGSLYGPLSQEDCKCICAHKYGCALVVGILESGRKTTIRYTSDGNKANRGSGDEPDEVLYNPDGKDPQRDEIKDPKDLRPPAIGLGHELIHVLHYRDPFRHVSELQEELDTSADENLLRAEGGMTRMRKKYNKRDSNGDIKKHDVGKGNATLTGGGQGKICGCP